MNWTLLLLACVLTIANGLCFWLLYIHFEGKVQALSAYVIVITNRITNNEEELHELYKESLEVLEKL